jgi:tetratricopeptide (TPR) repeat protein
MDTCRSAAYDDFEMKGRRCYSTFAMLVFYAWLCVPKAGAGCLRGSGQGCAPTEEGIGRAVGACYAPHEERSEASGFAQGDAGHTTVEQSLSDLQRAKALIESGGTTEAEKIVRQFLQGHADSAEGHFLLGYILFREIQTEAQAEGAMRYSVDPSLAQFRDAHARASLAEFTTGAKYDRPSAFDLKIVAYDYVLLDDFPDADKWMTRSLEWSPKDSDAWYSLGRIKYNENRFEEANRAFEECLRLEPRNVKAEDNLGLSYYALGRTNEAVTAYQTAIAWQRQGGEKNPRPFIDLGTLYLEQDRPKDALPFFLEATQIAPEDAKGHEELGKTYAHLNELSQAQGEFEKAVALAPNVASLHFMLGHVYRKEGMIEKAKSEFQRTEELNGTHSSDKK